MTRSWDGLRTLLQTSCLLMVARPTSTARAVFVANERNRCGTRERGREGEQARGREREGDSEGERERGREGEREGERETVRERGRVCGD